MSDGRGDGAELDTLTVLFTDLVGSTELRSRLGEDVAEVVRRAHDALIAGVVEGNGGRVVKGLGEFADMGGIKVLLKWWLLAGTAVVTVVMSLLSGMFALRSVRQIEPMSLLR